MVLSSLMNVLSSSVWLDDMLVWVVGTGAGIVALYAVVNALDMVYDNTEAG